MDDLNLSLAPKKVTSVWYCIMTQIKKRIWTWNGHVIRMPTNAILKVAIRWKPNATKRKSRKLKMEGDMEKIRQDRDERKWMDMELQWLQAEVNGVLWCRSTLYTTRHEEDKVSK